MCNTFEFMAKPSRPDPAEGGGTSNSGKHKLYEPRSCESNDVENAKGHARESGPL